MKPDRGTAYTTPKPVAQQRPDFDDLLRAQGEAKAILAVLDQQIREESNYQIDIYTARRIERCVQAFDDIHNRRKPAPWV